MAGQRALIVNFNGLGNGILFLPILKRLEEVNSNFYYFHINNPVLEIPEFVDWFRLKNLLGLVPPEWRRFNPGDWSAIKDFISSNQVSVIVNLRNEGPEYDHGYFAFKREMDASSLKFWELDHRALYSRVVPENLIHDSLETFRSHGLDLNQFNRLWLKDFMASRGLRSSRADSIGLFTAVSQKVKRWPIECWTELGERILKTTRHRLVVFAGISSEEREFASEVIARLQRKSSEDRSVLVITETLIDLCYWLNDLRLVISNDTVCVHIAAALDLPAVGLYFSTDSRIWGGLNDRALPIQSRFGLACPAMKSNAGNCLFYYGECPAPCKQDITPERVFSGVQAALKSNLEKNGDGE